MRNVKVEKFVTGPLETNTYVVYTSSNNSIIIDPSSGLDSMISFLTDKNLIPLAIIITHGHFDHIIGIPEIVKKYGEIPVFIHPLERETLTDPYQNMSFMMGKEFSYKGEIRDLTEGEFSIDDIKGRVLFVPGHSIGGCALLIDSHLFCGDILFAGSIGRTDFPGGNYELLIKGIKEKILTLTDDTVVCPGHGGRTTIKRERFMNPYLV
ncbi:MAG: MBL fold metallo-hydrolase [Chitinispirillaceae bacterium]|nr:MBL fold metallo-hydrolase [Chitinispirillaceae bacterium]